MLEKNSSVSLHQQLMTLIREKLSSGEWKANQKIPSENELAAAYGVSRMTVRAVITDLVNERLLYRVQGKGTFVSNTEILVTAKGVHSFRQQLEESGYSYETQIYQCKRMEATEYLKKIFSLSPAESEILFVYAVTKMGNEAICIHKAFIPLPVDNIVTKENLNISSLLDLLRLAGYKTVNITENIKCVFPGEQDAKALQVSKGHPVLLVADIHRDEKGKPFLLYEYAFRGERVSINVQFQDNRMFSFTEKEDVI